MAIRSRALAAVCLALLGAGDMIVALVGWFS